MSRFERIAVYGGGSWGTALACLVARSCLAAPLFLRDQAIIAEIQNFRTNNKYLGKIMLPSNIAASNQLSSLLDQQMIIIATPSAGFSDTLSSLKDSQLPPNIVLLIATKGLASQPTRLLSEQISSILPNPVAFIYGPNFAKEVAKDLLTPATIACQDLSLAKKIAASLASKNFVTTITDDIVTVQIAGVVKNIIAIKSGLYKASGHGENARAGLITGGLQEIMALSKIFGGRFDTLLSYAVIGDLVLTCHSGTSRNAKFGYKLGKNKDNIDQFLQNYPYLVEGVESTKLVINWLKQYDLDLPIIASVAAELNITAS